MTSTNPEQCPDNYSYWMEQFCFKEDEAAFWTCVAIFLLFVESGVAIFFIKKSKKTIQKITFYDPNNKDNKTYCMFSLWIIRLMQI